jgi:hypothetical protein
MPATNDELLAELTAIRQTIEGTNRALSGKASRWSVRAVGFSVALSLAVGVSGIVYAANTTHRLCVAANDGRADIRRMVSDVMVEEAEAIVSVAKDADPKVVEAFRAETLRRAGQITSRLPDRAC